jgi:hypothetical protein
MYRYTGLFKMTVGIQTTCHTQYNWDRTRYVFFLIIRTTLQVFVTYLTGALYVHPLWFYKHQHDNRVRSTRNAFSLPFAAILVNCAPSGEMQNYCTPHTIKENFENFLIHRCNYVDYSYLKCIIIIIIIIYLLTAIGLSPGGSTSGSIVYEKLLKPGNHF